MAFILGAVKKSHCILVLVPINPRSPRSTSERGYLMKERERDRGTRNEVLSLNEDWRRFHHTPLFYIQHFTVLLNKTV